jgi:hypothetical protein
MFFELEDIKRRHSPYWDCHNVHSWVRTPDSTHSWMLEVIKKMKKIKIKTSYIIIINIIINKERSNNRSGVIFNK